MSQNQLMPPAQWPVIMMLIHQTLKQLDSKLHTPITLWKVSPQKRAGFSDPDSAWSSEIKPSWLSTEYTFIWKVLSGIRKQSKGWDFFVSVIKAHSYPFSTKAVRGPVRSGCLTSNQFFLWFHSKRTGSWPQWHQLFAGPVPTSAYIRGWGRDYRLLFGVNKNQRIVVRSNCDEQHKCVRPVVFGWHSVTLVRRWYGPPLLLKS